MRKTTQLKNMLNSQQLEFLMEAHNGLSARIATEAGFRGLWASGLAISASLGVRDNNEASWTQILDVVEFMADVTSNPILLDGDTGYGNFNNFRRLVKKLEQRGVAGVCIEDKLFPKTNSFIAGEAQPLAEIEEFCGKIKAGKDAQTDADFCVVARVEAFIAGWGLDEALHRAEAYQRAGADAILIHSKKNTPSDIEAFMAQWGSRHPIVIVPTKYYSTPTDRFRDIGISLVIWANHTIRSAVAAMQATTRRLYEEQSPLNIEDKIVPVSELFRLQGDDELRAAESRYLPRKGVNARGVVLAASRGRELGAITVSKPKAMLEVNGRPILYQLVHMLNEIGIKDVSVVTGYRQDAIQGQNFIKIQNEHFEETKDLYSLWLGLQGLTGSILVVYGDTLFRKHVLVDLLETEGDILVAVDADIKRDGKVRDYAFCSEAFRNDFVRAKPSLVSITTATNPDQAHGEWTGVMFVAARMLPDVKAVFEGLREQPDFSSLSVTDLLNALAKKHRISVVYTRGGWIDVDDAFDVEKAGEFMA